ncbi:MAG: cation-efflux pump [Candidatus Thermoplasmatota archaeon]|nr:cation-efflux pump [Candidatus Thermoplasmatota archaeon]
MTKRPLKIIPEYGDPDDPETRAKYGNLEATVSIIGNTLLFLLKLILGLFINSIALIADGVHSLSDVSTSGVVIFGFRIAKKQPDKDHPHGHGRAEYIATLIIAILLIIVGIGFIQQSIERIFNPKNILHEEYTIIISAIVLITAIGKELMAKYSFKIAKKINSDVLKADAWHHRSDAISSIGVAIGILGARYGFPILDPIFGLMVSVIIIYVGINLVKTASNFLIGQGPDKQLINKIKEIANSTEKVQGIHEISLHDYGTTKILTLHAEVNSNLLLEDAHKIADNLEKNIFNQTKFSTIIHLDPVQISGDSTKKRKIIKEILKHQKQIKSFHKIQIIQSGEKDEIKMHIVVDRDMPINDSHELCHIIKSNFEKQYGPCEVDIHFEPCIGDCKACTIACSKRSK